MKLAWKDTLLGAILYDAETGQIVGEVIDTEIGGATRRHHATFLGNHIGDYITREFARKAMEAAAMAAPSKEELLAQLRKGQV